MKKQLINLSSKIQVKTQASINDYQYNCNGTNLALCDSSGYVYVYYKVGESYQFNRRFQADQAAIWKVSWAHPKYGRVIAIASFKNKVAIFQQKNNQWTQVISHYLHEGSVNSLAWAHTAYGLKLYSGGSDGKIAVLQLKHGNWKSFSFNAHSVSIHAICLSQIPLNENQQGYEELYPRLVTAGKDNIIKIWDSVNNQYSVIASCSAHKQLVRTVLWRPKFDNDQNYQICSCSDDGSVKILQFNQKGLSEQIKLFESQNPVTKISQSITGNLINISTTQSSDNLQVTYIFQQKDSNVWQCIKKCQDI